MKPNAPHFSLYAGPLEVERTATRFDLAAYTALHAIAGQVEKRPTTEPHFMMDGPYAAAAIRGSRLPHKEMIASMLSPDDINTIPQFAMAAPYDPTEYEGMPIESRIGVLGLHENRLFRVVVAPRETKALPDARGYYIAGVLDGTVTVFFKIDNAEGTRQTVAGLVQASATNENRRRLLTGIRPTLLLQASALDADERITVLTELEKAAGLSLTFPSGALDA